MDPSESKQNVLFLACGALAREVTQYIALNGLEDCAVSCLPAKLHHRPELIPELLRKRIRRERDNFEKIVVLYGDCGTAGEIDRVLEEEGGIERIDGPHCFSFYHGNDAFAQAREDELETFYLTDFFCRHFDRFVWTAFALDRRPDMVEFVFGNYKKLVYIAQTEDATLQARAEEAARRLRLDYEYRFVGFGDLASFMADAGPSQPNA